VSILKKILLLMLCISMISLPTVSFAAENSDIYLYESFNNIISGGVPEKGFLPKKAGGELAVVEIPDAVNKSMFLNGSTGGSAAVEAEFASIGNQPTTISFRFMVPGKSSWTMPEIADNGGHSDILLEAENNVLKASGNTLLTISPKKWYYAEVALNFTRKYYRVTIDGANTGNTYPFVSDNISHVFFEAKGENAQIYIDDLKVFKSTLGGPGWETWPSKLWTTEEQQQVVDDISYSNFTMFNASKIAYKNGLRMEMPAPVREIEVNFEKVLYVPLRFTAENIGAEVVWNNEENAVYMMFGGKTIKVLPGDSNAYIDSAAAALKYDIRNIGGTVYISADDISELLGKEMNTEDGYVMFGADWDYYKEAPTAVREELYRMVKYERPSGQQIYDTLVANNPNKSHPRLFGNADAFARLNEMWKGENPDPFMKKALDLLEVRANDYVDDPLYVYKAPGSGGRNFSSNACARMVYTCALMYKLTGNEEYGQRAKDEIMNFMTWPTLGHNNILDMGDHAEMIGVTYDWLYDFFTPEEKKTILEVTKEKLLKPYLNSYRGGGVEGYENMGVDWVYSRFNLNSHNNAGIISLLMGIGDEYDSATIEEYIIPLMGYSLRSAEFFLDEWYPDGAWQEGPGYGAAVLSQLSVLVGALQSALGTDFGLSSVPGIKESGIWGLCMEGPVAIFNYANADEVYYGSGETHKFWMASVLNEPIFAQSRIKSLEKNHYSNLLPIELFDYKPEYNKGYASLSTLDNYFRKLESTTMRSGWGENDLFLGFHSGYNGIDHSQLDTGTFVLDFGGTRFAKEVPLHSETSKAYTPSVDYGTGYFDRAEGHNTITIDQSPYMLEDETQWPEVFRDDFEDETVNTDPVKYRVHEGSYFSDATDEEIETVLNVEKEPNADNKALRIDMSESRRYGYYYEKTLGNTNTAMATKAVEISFRLNVERMNDKYEPMGLAYINSPADTNTGKAAAANGFLCIKGNKLFVPKYIDGKAQQTEIALINFNEWIDVKITADPENQLLNVWINGKHCAKDFPMLENFTNINYVRFSSSANYYAYNFKGYIDDIVIRSHPDDTAFTMAATRLFDQIPYRVISPITRFESKAKGSLAITDMTPAYATWAKSARRGVMLTQNREAVVIRDEVKLKKKSDLYWFMHSAKNAVEYHISEDGKSVIMEGIKTGARVYGEIFSDKDVKFEVRECVPLPGSPNPPNQADNSGLHKLAIKFEGIENIDYSVALIPLKPGEDKPSKMPEILPLDEWSLPDGEIPALDSLTLDGKLIDEFDPRKTIYSIKMRDDQSVPYIAATYKGQPVEITQPESLYDSVAFTITDGSEVVEYKVQFLVEKVTYAYIQGNPITDDMLFASESVTAAAPPKYLIDRNEETACAPYGEGEWIMLDFEEKRDFSKLEILWSYGNERKYKFDILASDDGIKWEKISSFTSSGKGEDYETYEFGKTVNTRMLKIVGYGSDKNLYLNMKEIR